jgi:NAD(P)-dependent dehydrogenase (short-subunit alcohol dehydrogenase family)
MPGLRAELTEDSKELGEKMRLEKKTAIITGAGTEFGKAIAMGYAREGASLYLHDFPENEPKLAKVAEQVGRSGRRVFTGLYDLTRGDAAAAMLKDVLEKLDAVDILVNTTQGGWHGKFFECREADWDKAIDRGLKAYFLTCQHFGKEMARRGKGGKIINITSIVGALGSGQAVPWGSARGGVNSLTAAVAQALGPYGINCTALARGATDATPYSDAAKAERLRRLPFGRLGREDDIVGPAIFLATSDSDWITGSVVYCDGGYVTAAATDDEYRPTEFPYRGS